MKNKTNERISALLDGQLGRFETRRWTDELVKDEQLSGRLSRYQLIGDALRGDLPERLNNSFSQSVMAKLDEQPAIQVQQQREWKKPVTGLAIAASVALVSVFGLNSLVAPTSDPVAVASLSGEAQELARVLPAAPQTKVVTAKTTPVSVKKVSNANETGQREPAVRQLRGNQAFLTNYIATHSQYADPSSMMSHIRLVGYELNPQE